VYFWLKAEADPTLVSRFRDGLERLTAIPDIQTAHFGRPEATEKRAVIEDSYSWGLVETFADLKAHDRYQAHPIHQDFLREFAACWERVQVYDVHV
jgi:hypothetical protein